MSVALGGALCVNLCFISTPASAAAPGDDRVAVSVAAGAFWPSEQAFSDVYGNPQWPLLVQLDVQIVGPFGAFGGVRLQSSDGETIAAPPVTIEERFPLELTSTALRFGGSARARLGAADVTASVGAERWSGTERWPALGQSYDFEGWGWLVQGAVRVPVWWRIAALALVEFEHAPIPPASPGSATVDVGGITLAAGVSLRF